MLFTFDSVDVSSLLHSVRRAQLEIDVLKASVGIQRDATVDLTEIVKAVDLRMAAVETASIVPAVPVAMVTPAAVVDADDNLSLSLSNSPRLPLGLMTHSGWHLVRPHLLCLLSVRRRRPSVRR